MERRAATLKQMRIIHAVFLLTVFLIALQAEKLAATGTGYSMTFLGVMILVASFDALIAFYIRRKRLFPALEKLRRDFSDTGALNEWRSSTLLSLILTMTVALYGLVLRVLGASRNVSWPFFVSALILMLVWRPRLDLRDEASNTGISQ